MDRPLSAEPASPAEPVTSVSDRSATADDYGILPERLRKRREALARRPLLNKAYRIGVGIVGTVVLIVGVIAIPYPGPGWLIVFSGLGILATEFAWAHRVLKFARSKYDAFADWLKKQHWAVQGLFGIGTFVIVVATLWLLGALKLAAGWVGIHYSWLASPLF